MTRILTDNGYAVDKLNNGRLFLVYYVGLLIGSTFTEDDAMRCIALYKTRR